MRQPLQTHMEGCEATKAKYQARSAGTWDAVREEGCIHGIPCAPPERGGARSNETQQWYLLCRKGHGGSVALSGYQIPRARVRRPHQLGRTLPSRASALPRLRPAASWKFARLCDEEVAMKSVLCQQHRGQPSHQLTWRLACQICSESVQATPSQFELHAPPGGQGVHRTSLWS